MKIYTKIIFDSKNNLLEEKYFTYDEIDTYQILREVQVTNIQNNHSTHLKFENIEINTGIKDDLFHERHLKRLPK